MGQGTGRHAWWRHLAIVAAYAVCYALLRSVSVSNWNLPAGLRLACLLLMPYRYWPALILGEAIPVGHEVWSCYDQFGAGWASIAAIPPIVLCAPVVAWFRRRGGLFDGGSQASMAAVLLSALAFAAITAIRNSAALSLVHLPGGALPPAVTVQVVFVYFLGNYLGALTLAPAALALRLWLAERLHEPAWPAVRGSALARDCAIGLVPSLAVLTWLASTDDFDTMQICRILMFLPVAWLALRHGWQGAAFGGMLASVAVAITSTTARDPAVIQAQALIAFVISTLLIFGARIAQEKAVRATQGKGADTASFGLRQAQQSLYLEEMRLRHFAETLEHIGQSVSEHQGRLLERLRHSLSASEERAYFRRAAVTQHEMHRLAKALYPRAVLERGLSATFEDGSFARAIAMAGASYRCRLAGGGLDQFAADVQMALYRLACEMLVLLLTGHPVGHVRLQLRSGSRDGRRWVVMRLVGTKHPDPASSPMQPDSDAWQQVMSLLGASGLEIAPISDRAQIYGGKAYLRDFAGGTRATLLLQDALRVAPVAEGTGARVAPRGSDRKRGVRVSSGVSCTR
ncbi:hypothetical protein ASG87_08630 [Frateuria sp. Soil773]|uniref:MASE1 domain-containing protein n=1 Tax=Frateuria sp. Soil773 TaxID=1736407 RepID=UPI000715A37D|nr:MASE1 domain-containing protein [Frateuria sp. Soil773]KRE88636.1 hypothetical protein ASG87_08630 [Frateuria sp. Soil773]